MIFALERVTQPDIEPLTLAEMRLHLRTFDSETVQDTKITGIIEAAREWVEGYTGRALIDQQWRLSIGHLAWPFANGGATTPGVEVGQWSPGVGGIWLRKSPVIAIVSVATVGTDYAETVVDADDYAVQEADGKWPRLLGVGESNTRITFRAGYANRNPDQGEPPAEPPIAPDTAAMVPERYKQAMFLYAEAIYDRDEKMMKPLLEAAENLIRPERCELQIA